MFLDFDELGKNLKIMNLADEVQATVIALILLQKHFETKKDIWKLVALKAKKYLVKALKLANNKEVDSYIVSLGEIKLIK
jgi:hypothetical protein